MPPLEHYPGAYRSNEREEDFTKLELRVKEGTLRKINFKGDSIYFPPYASGPSVMMAYSLETGSGDLYSPRVNPRRVRGRNWLKKLALKHDR